jgi:hypothetical protein
MSIEMWFSSISATISRMAILAARLDRFLRDPCDAAVQQPTNDNADQSEYRLSHVARLGDLAAEARRELRASTHAYPAGSRLLELRQRGSRRISLLEPCFAAV